jgi:hypothetical protein
MGGVLKRLPTIEMIVPGEKSDPDVAAFVTDVTLGGELGIRAKVMGGIRLKQTLSGSSSSENRRAIPMVRAGRCGTTFGFRLTQTHPGVTPFAGEMTRKFGVSPEVCANANLKLSPGTKPELTHTPCGGGRL